MAHADADRIVRAEIARRFYLEGETKREIAEALGMSRFKVARLLERALAEGTVRIEIEQPPETDEALAEQLRRATGLSMAVVARGDDVPAIAPVAAAALEQLLEPGETLGVGWGSTLSAIGEALADGLDLGVRVVQASGGLAGLASGERPDETASRFARRLGGTAATLTAPALVGEPGVRDALLANPAVRPTVALFDEVSTVLVGIGALGEDDRSALVRSGFLDAEALRRLRDAGATGDLLLYPFDDAGRFVDDGLEERAIALPLDALRRARLIAVAGGAGKEAAVTSALRTGVVDVLVTDARCARAAVRELSPPGRARPARAARPRTGS